MTTVVVITSARSGLGAAPARLHTARRTLVPVCHVIGSVMVCADCYTMIQPSTLVTPSATYSNAATTRD